MQEGMPLREYLDQLNTILLDLRNIDVKIEDEDAALILLVSLPSSYENFVQSFVVGKDTITLEEVRSSLHTRELRHKATGTVIDNQATRLVATSWVKGQGNSKKGSLKNLFLRVLNLPTSVITAKKKGIRKPIVLRKRSNKKNLVLLL